MDPATVLPEELIHRFLSHLPHSPDFANLACLSKRWQSLVSGALESRKKISLLGFEGQRSICWNPLYTFSDINERSGVSVATYGHSLYFFGGRADNETAMNDLTVFDLLTMKWQRLTTEGSRPAPRSNAVIGFLMDQLFLYGGHRCPLRRIGGAVFPPSSHTLRMLVINDLYSFHRKTNTWKCILREEDSPRLCGNYNGVFLQPKVSDSDTFPGLLVLFEAEQKEHRTVAIMPETGFWFILPDCPQTPMELSNPVLAPRPPMCALSETDILIITQDVEVPTVWILSRRGRTSASKELTDGWSWTEVRLKCGLNTTMNPVELLEKSDLLCLPKLSHQEWPIVAALGKEPFGRLRFELARRLWEGSVRRPNSASAPSPSTTLSSSDSSYPSSVILHSTSKSNPMIQVFDELHDPTKPAGTPGQPIRGVIIRRAASASSSSSLIRVSRGCHKTLSKRRRSLHFPGLPFPAPIPALLSSDESEGESDSDLQIMVLTTLSLSCNSDQRIEGVVTWMSEEEYRLEDLPLTDSRHSAFAYGLGSLLVFGVPRTHLLDLEYQNELRDTRPIAWVISGRKAGCGFKLPPTPET